MKENLRQTWDTISESWSNLRTRPWKEVLEFSKSVEKGVVLDIGCGNCRNLLPFISNKIPSIGMDFSRGMIKQSKKFLKKFGMKTNLVIGDFTNLPFKSESIPVTICNAVLHDVYLKEDRKKSLEELKRIATNDGKILLSVWGRNQKRFILPLIRSLLTMHFADIWVDWNCHGKKHKRFYHLYTEKELKDGLQGTGLNTERIWQDQKGNIWCLVGK